MNKIGQLRILVREAHLERKHAYPNRHKSVHGSEFEPAGIQTYHLEHLLEVLTKTDALEVLYEQLWPEEVEA